MDIPPPLMGEGEGGGGQGEDLLGPPSPSFPPAEGRGDSVGLCLFNYGLLSKSKKSSFLLAPNLKCTDSKALEQRCLSRSYAPSV